jgi:uncharacterized protein (DUF1810 family)
MADVQRFRDAQERCYDTVREEIRAGSKRTHWMWFIFPQMKGLGKTTTSDHYGISGRAEARAYLDDPVLGPRLAECAAGVLAHNHLMFGFPDNLKLRSSMTLFAQVADDPAPFEAVIAKFYDGPDAETVRLLGQ